MTKQNFKPGDKVRIVRGYPDGSLRLREGAIHVVRGTRPSRISNDRVIVYLEGVDMGLYDDRFELVEKSPRTPASLPQVAFVVDTSYEIRSYDAQRGDERRFAQSAALKRAEERAVERGVRQQVRLSGPALAGGDPLWLIQDVA